MVEPVASAYYATLMCFTNIDDREAERDHNTQPTLTLFVYKRSARTIDSLVKQLAERALRFGGSTYSTIGASRSGITLAKAITKDSQIPAFATAICSRSGEAIKDGAAAALRGVRRARHQRRRVANAQIITGFKLFVCPPNQSWRSFGRGWHSSSTWPCCSSDSRRGRFYG